MLKFFKKILPVLITVILMSLLIIISPFDKNVPQQQEKTDESLEGIVLNVSKDQDDIQKLELEITKGSIKGQTVYVKHENAPMTGPKDFEIGNKLVVVMYTNAVDEVSFFIADYVRNTTLIWLFIIFVVVLVSISRWQGFSALLGMVSSFVILFKYSLPQILSGAPPVEVAIISSLFIIPFTFYLSHGISKKTHIAVFGTLITLLITGFLANLFADLTHLTGLSSEATVYLSDAAKNNMDFRGLLLAGMIISVLGVLDDITISQASVVQELINANPKLKFKELYSRAMKVGQDHIASMVNTLVLVYAGASLPLLLLFLDYSESFFDVINFEFMAGEIIQTIVGSIGLIAAVPITTFLAVSLATKLYKKPKTA